ncbi:MAG: RHS repeat-associated core domain-containing protein, partial [Candidatus Thiodiazotropha endolucinida]
EYDQNGQAIREYITLEGQPVALIVTDPVTTLSSVYYLHTDHLGAVVKATDSAQALVWDAERKPFGERSVTTAQIEMPLGFPGQYFDEESGNYYNYFRDYDPSTGRYLQSDPIGLLGGLNTYTYVHQNPLTSIDPFGLFCWGSNCHGPKPAPLPYTPPSTGTIDSSDNIIPFPPKPKPSDGEGEGASCPPPNPGGGSDCKFTGLAGVVPSKYGFYLECQYKCPRKGLQIDRSYIGLKSKNPAFLCPKTMPESWF